MSLQTSATGTESEKRPARVAGRNPTGKSRLIFQLNTVLRISALLAVARLPFLLPLLPITAPAGESYLDNGIIKIGVDSTQGGSITWLSLSGTTNNIVNRHDLGRDAFLHRRPPF